MEAEKTCRDVYKEIMKAKPGRYLPNNWKFLARKCTYPAAEGLQSAIRGAYLINRKILQKEHFKGEKDYREIIASE